MTTATHQYKSSRIDSIDSATYPNHEFERPEGMRAHGGPPPWEQDLMEARRTGILPLLGFKQVIFDDGVTDTWKRTDDNGLTMYIVYPKWDQSRGMPDASWMYVRKVGVPTTVRFTEKLWRAVLDRMDNSTLLTHFS